MTNATTDAPPALGIDFGGTSVKIGVCEGAAVLRTYPRLETAAYDGAEPLIDEIIRVIAEVREEFPTLAAIGVGMPGFVNSETGTVHALTNVQGWEGVSLKKRLTEATGLPVMVENDANAMAYAEWRHGAGQGRQYLLAMTLGTGVGGGLILGGELYRGATYGAGEIGQISIDWSGRLGGHGNFGALERYVGNGPISQRAAEVYAERGLPLVDDSPEALAHAAAAGDAAALAVWEEIARQLAVGLSNVLWVLNLDCVVVGGGVARAGEVLFGPLRKYLEVQMDASFTDQLLILPAHFGNEAGMIGAAALALAERESCFS